MLLIAGTIICAAAIIGLIILLLGLGLLYLAKGLWDLEGWAWMWALILQFLGLPVMAWNFISGSANICTVIQAIIWLVIVVYLFMVKSEFDAGRSPSTYESYGESSAVSTPDEKRDEAYNALFGRELKKSEIVYVAGKPVNAACPKCGSAAVSLYSDGSGICQKCGNAFMSPRDGSGGPNPAPVKPVARPACDNCGSTELLWIEGTSGKCAKCAKTFPDLRTLLKK